MSQYKLKYVNESYGIISRAQKAIQNIMSQFYKLKYVNSSYGIISRAQKAIQNIHKFLIDILV